MTEMSKLQLLQSIQSGYKLFNELLAEFNDQQMILPGVVGEWSIKDTVAHIVVHERRMLQWMNETLRGEHPSMPQPYSMPDDELDQLNEQIYRDNKNEPLDEVVRALEKTHAEVLKFVEAACEEDIFDVSRLNLRDGEPLWEAIAANTFWHYEEHGRDIQVWQARSLVGAQKNF